MAHHLGGEEVHVAPRQDRPGGCRNWRSAARMPKPVRSRIRSIPRQHRLGAADEARWPLSRWRPSAVAFPGRPAPSRMLTKVLHRAHRGVARRHQHLEGLAQEVVERGSRPPARLPRGRARRCRRHKSGTPSRVGRAPPHSRIAGPGRDRCCGSAPPDRLTRTSPGTDTCARDRRPTRPSRSTPATGSRSAGAASDRDAARC